MINTCEFSLYDIHNSDRRFIIFEQLVIKIKYPQLRFFYFFILIKLTNTKFNIFSQLNNKY